MLHGGRDCRKVVCIHLHKSGQQKGQAAAALTGAPATAEAAVAEDHLKVALTAPPLLHCLVPYCAVHRAVRDML